MNRTATGIVIGTSVLLVAASVAGCSRQGPSSGGVSLAREAPIPAPPEEARTVPWELDWVRGSVFYQVFVRSFADSDGDGVGDLRGLIGKLDYLNDGDPSTTTDLGVDGIWLMPVFESPSYHGYDVVDYETIDREYGTNEDFERLCAEADRRGIQVIVDLVLNHSGAGHPWFEEASSSTTSPKRDWYVWRSDDPGWTQPWGAGRTWHKARGGYYYGLFWGGMPDLNWRNPEVRSEMARIANLWLDRGADGFRLDATRHLIEAGPGGEGGQSDAPATFDALREFSARVRMRRPGALLVGENWTDTTRIAPYFGATDALHGGDVLPMNFNFPLAGAIVEAARTGQAAPIVSVLGTMADLYPAGALDAPFLTNHDMVRIATELDGDRAKLGAAAAVLLTLPGTPFLYYGEEIGLANGPGRDDPQKRTPMPWDASPTGGFTTGTPWHDFAPGKDEANVAAESADPRSLLSRYKALIRIRKGLAALRGVAIEVLTPVDESTPLLAYVRRAEGEALLVVHNLGDAETTGPDWVPAAAVSGEAVFGDARVGIREGPGGPVLALPPHSTGIWRLGGSR